APVHGRAAADVLADVVLHREMAGREIGPQIAVVARFVREDHCRLFDWLAQDWLEGCGVDFRNAVRLKKGNEYASAAPDAWGQPEMDVVPDAPHPRSYARAGIESLKS